MTIIVESDLLKGFGESFKLSLGRAEDRHLLRLAGDSAGLFQPVKLPGRDNAGRYVRFFLPPHERFPDCAIKAQNASFERDEKKRVIMITLPAWAWDDKVKRDMETAPPVKLRKAA